MTIIADISEDVGRKGKEDTVRGGSTQDEGLSHPLIRGHDYDHDHDRLIGARWTRRITVHGADTLGGDDPIQSRTLGRHRHIEGDRRHHI